MKFEEFGVWGLKIRDVDHFILKVWEAEFVVVHLVHSELADGTFRHSEKKLRNFVERV